MLHRDSDEPILAGTLQGEDYYKTSQLVFDLDTSRPDKCVVLKPKVSCVIMNSSSKI